jgi:hypothetical protein
MKKHLFFVLMLSTCSVFAKEIRFDLHLNQDRWFKNIVLTRLEKDSLFFIDECSEKGIHLIELDQIFKLRKSGFRKGAGIGLIGGTIVGAIIGRLSYKKPKHGGFISFDFGPGFSTFGGALLGGGAGFLVGGIIGYSRGESKKEYNLSELSLKRKRIVVQTVMKNQM